MSVAVFVDTNILVYARDASERKKQPSALRWLEVLWRRRAGRVSLQVLQEYYVVVTTKLRPGLPVEEARSDLRALSAWRPIPLDGDLLEQGWVVPDRFGFAFWDAMIVAAARRAGCEFLLTEDLQDGQSLDGLSVVDPFRHDPAEVLPDK